MNNLILVSSFERDLISKFKNRAFVIYTHHSDKIIEINQRVLENNGLYCIQLNADQSLSSLHLNEKWNSIPLFLNCTDLGNFKDFLRKKQVLSKLNVKVFFPSNPEENYINLKILSSLGINCGIVFKDLVNWTMVSDLMTYFVYTRIPHGQIEPFNFVVENYDPMKQLDFNSIYFNDPAKFLHMDKNENIALTYENLLKGEFLAHGAQAMEDIESNPDYVNALIKWQEFFLQESGCAYCPAWRVCLGKFAESMTTNPGCREFFSELMDATDHFQNAGKKKVLE